jgi:hypothetical protein
MKITKRVRRKIFISANILFWGALLVFAIVQAAGSYIALHAGANIESVSGIRYRPVFNESIIASFLVLISLLWLVFSKKDYSRIFIITVASIEIVVLALFVIWSYWYTHRSLMEGLITGVIVVICISLFVLPLLLYERFIYKLRKKTRGKHPLVKLWDSVERLQEFQCQCDAGGKIYLGLRWVRWVNYSIVAAVIISWACMTVDNSAHDMITPLFFMTIVVLCMFAWNYAAIYRDMRIAGHSVHCSNQASLRGIFYSGKASAHSISRKKAQKSP